MLLLLLLLLLLSLSAFSCHALSVRFPLLSGGIFADWISNKGFIDRELLRRASYLLSNVISCVICAILATGPPPYVIGIALFLKNLVRQMHQPRAGWSSHFQ